MILEHSDQWAEVAAALGKAQSTIENPTKTKTANAGTYSFAYNDLASVLDTCRKPFADNALTILQPPAVEDRGVVSVQTLIVHAGGQWLGCTLTATGGTKPQDIGAVITYLRRYGLQSLAGIAAEDDEQVLHDATVREERANRRQNQPQGVRPQQQPQTQRPSTTGRPMQAPQERASVAVPPALTNEPPAASEFISDIQRRKLWNAATGIGWREDELKAFLKTKFNIDGTKQIPTARYDEIVTAIEAGDEPKTSSGAAS